jgi:hypothetical protein
MGGIGSGRPRRGERRRVESCSVLDVNVLRREGRLRPGLSTMVTLSPSQENVGVLADEMSLRLSRRVTSGEDDVVTYQAVGLHRSPCNLGGKRTYFICSGVGSGHACGRRVDKLYAARQYFLCRHCLGLAYASQSEAAWGRAQLRASKTRRRITRDPDINAPLPFAKPKYMHWRTFNRLHAEAKKAKLHANEAFLADCFRKFSFMEHEISRTDPRITPVAKK